MCNAPAYDDIPDSLLTVGEIRKTVLSDPDKALYMLDVAEERKLLPTYQINWTRAQIYGSAKNMERVAVKWGKLVIGRRFGAVTTRSIFQYVQEPGGVDDCHRRV